MSGMLASPNKTSANTTPPVKTSPTKASSVGTSPLRTSARRISADRTSPHKVLVALMTLLLPLSLVMSAARAAEAVKAPASVTNYHEAARHTTDNERLSRDFHAKETSGYGPRTTYYGRYFGLAARTRNAQRLASRLGAKQEPAPGMAVSPVPASPE